MSDDVCMEVNVRMPERSGCERRARHKARPRDKNTTPTKLKRERGNHREWFGVGKKHALQPKFLSETRRTIKTQRA